MNKFCRPALLVIGLWATAVSAALITEPVRTFTVGSDIPDLQDPPLSFLGTVNDSAILSLTDVVVGLHLVGNSTGEGFASDMFVSLIKSPVGGPISGVDPSAILLNRAGISSTDSTGFGYDGWDVAFQNGAAGGDVHLVNHAGGVLTGTYEADGRSGDPATDPASMFLLDVFDTGAGNGDWRINVADLAASGTMRLQSWSLTLTGLTFVPEPSTYATGLAMIGLVGARWWRQRRN